MWTIRYNTQVIVDYLCAFFKKLHIKNIESGVNQMDKKNILTYEGLKKLEDELQNLKVVKRKEVAQKIKEAREQGDLSENAEYDAAKDNRTIRFQDVINGDPVFTGGFHTDILAIPVEQPLQQSFQTARVGRKPMALVRSDAFIVRRSDTGNYKSLVDINATADFVHDF